jgi:hypothetical protein
VDSVLRDTIEQIIGLGTVLEAVGKAETSEPATALAQLIEKLARGVTGESATEEAPRIKASDVQEVWHATDAEAEAVNWDRARPVKTVEDVLREQKRNGKPSFVGRD